MLLKSEPPHACSYNDTPTWVIWLAACSVYVSALAAPASHVLVVGCDGFGSVGFRATNTPVLHSPEYFRAVEDVDGLIGGLLNALSEAGIRDQTVVIMTADHGGKGKSHGEPTMDEIEIPVIMAGPGVRRGHEIKSAVNTYDTAATIVALFELKAPDVWIGKRIGEVFEATED